MPEKTVGGMDGAEKWMHDVTASVALVNESLNADQSLHPGKKAIAMAIISNAAKKAGDLADAKRFAEIRNQKMLSNAIERVLDLVTTERQPTSEEIGELVVAGISSGQYASLEAKFKNHPLVINAAANTMIHQELEDVYALGA